MQTNISAHAPPWYEQRWPWLLMAGPFVVVVAGFVTLYLAIVHNDGLVADDYYKEGKAINRSLKRDTAAADAGIRAAITFSERDDAVSVHVHRADNSEMPKSLRLRLAHATRAGLDQTIPLTASSLSVTTGSDYRGALGVLSPGRWHIELSDIEKTWRLTDTIDVGTRALATIQLEPLNQQR
jgi:uncharacterized protein